MRLYAESSAILSWLLGEPEGREVAERIRVADEVLASELTLVECKRTLVRMESSAIITASTASELLAILNRAARRWEMLSICREIWDRAARPFPAEPIRTLDALHVATAAVTAERLPDLYVLSRDRRVRESCLGLGLEVLP